MKIFAVWWGSKLWGLHFISFMPGLVVNGFVLLFAEGSQGTKYFENLGEVAIWMLQWYTGNLSLLSLLIGFYTTLINWLFNIKKWAYLFFFLNYTSAAYYTMRFHVKNGEEIS